MSLSRRFLYLVVDQHKSRLSSPWYTLHRIDPSQLFFSDGWGNHGANSVVDAPLPESKMSFDLSRSMQFSLLGRSKDKIVGVDCTGGGILYDDTMQSVRPLPIMAAPKRCRTLSVAIDGVGAYDDGRVYVIEADPLQDLPGRRRHVQELVYQHNNKDWVWRSRLPPPYMRQRKGGEITCHTVDSHRKGDGSLVWVSAAGSGTYWLNTATHKWTKAGNWVLPFRGQAMPVPELGLWMGFSAVDSRHICASNLAAAVEENRPPAADHVWKGFAVPEGFGELYSQLVYLGDRRFCVSQVFEWAPHLRRCCCPCHRPDKDDKDENKCFTMFTGVQVAHASGGRYRVIKHRSLRYCLGKSDSVTACVL